MGRYENGSEGDKDYLMVETLGDGIWVENGDNSAGCIFLTLAEACYLRNYLNKLIEEVV